MILNISQIKKERNFIQKLPRKIHICLQGNKMKYVRLFFAKLHLFTFYDWQQNIKSEKTEGQMLENHKHFERNNFCIGNTALIENIIRHRPV